MYRKIMVPLDGSKLAECALEHVKTIAKGCSVPEVVLVSVIKTFHWWEDEIEDATVLEQVARDEEEQANEYLLKIKQALERDGLKTATSILEGNTTDRLLDFSIKNGVDLIIMSTHGRSGITRWALGSVADQMIRYSTVPVLVVAPTECANRT